MKARIEALRANGLLALCGLLLLVLLVELSVPLLPDSTGSSSAEAALKLPIARATSYRHPPFETYEAILERPLFFEDRRLPEPAVVDVAPPRPLRLELLGTAKIGTTRTALLKNLPDGRILSLGEGEEHDGWTLEAIGAGSVGFRRGAESTELPLSKEKGRRPR